MVFVYFFVYLFKGTDRKIHLHTVSIRIGQTARFCFDFVCRRNIRSNQLLWLNTWDSFICWSGDNRLFHKNWLESCWRTRLVTSLCLHRIKSTRTSFTNVSIGNYIDWIIYQITTNFLTFQYFAWKSVVSTEITGPLRWDSRCFGLFFDL